MELLMALPFMFLLLVIATAFVIQRLNGEFARLHERIAKLEERARRVKSNENLLKVAIDDMELLQARVRRLECPRREPAHYFVVDERPAIESH